MSEPMDQGAGLDRGNPAPAADAGQEGTGSFLDGLSQEPGSGAAPALQDGAQAARQDQGSPASANVSLPGFATALPKESRADQKILSYVSKFRSWDELTKAAVELETKLGGMVAVPNDDASPEVRAEFLKKIGVPDKPDDYTLGTDERVTADPAQVAEFRKLAHELGLTQKQAAEMWKRSNDAAAQVLSSTAEARAEQKKAALQSMVSTLKAEWGQDFQRNDGIVKRGIEAFGTDGFMKTAKENGYFSNPEFVKLFYRLGLAVQEDSTGFRGAMGKTQEASPRGLDRPGL